MSWLRSSNTKELINLILVTFLNLRLVSDVANLRGSWGLHKFFLFSFRVMNVYVTDGQRERYTTRNPSHGLLEAWLHYMHRLIVPIIRHLHIGDNSTVRCFVPHTS